ncbi:MAG TPA: right-handed parallel beta-helix repeat-containing protein [Haliangiales bacterium]|nr:right-handed parallel beta-helix repeat-containing protein [Haliangiales bacterium]
MIKYRTLSLAAALLVLAGAISAFAAQNFYVTPSGADTSPGTAAQPLREIRAALELVAPGDSILVADGTYLGFDVDSRTGTASAPITVRSVGTNAVVVKTTDRGDNRDTIHIIDSAFVIIDGLRSFDANRAALRVEGGTHITVRNCVLGNNATWGLFTDFSDDLLIENNECYASAAQHGIYVSNSGDRPTLRGNRCHDNFGSGIQLNADVNIQPGDGIITGALIENNVLYNNGAGGGGAVNLDGVQDSVIRNNLLFNNHASGIILFQIDGAEGPRGNQVYHNTIDMAADGRWDLNFLQTTGTNVARNNILLTRHSFRGGLRFGDANDVANTDSDYNVVTRITPDDNAILTLAEWQAQGRELHSITGTLTNLFVDTTVGNYHLLTNASAVDVAQPLPTVTADLEGNLRPSGGAPDMGCYELSPFALKISAFNGGQPLLRMSGGAGRTYRLDSSSALTNWVVATTLIQSNRPLEYLEANPLPGRRFYRASFAP